MQSNEWLELLSDEDLALVKRFVLASGSLKQMAAEYGVSYPTVRLRIDRLIAKIQVADAHTQAGWFELKLRAKYAEGRIDMETLKELLAAHRESMEKCDADDTTR